MVNKKEVGASPPADNRIQINDVGQYIKSLSFEVKKSRSEVLKLRPIEPQFEYRLSPRVEKCEGEASEYEVIVDVGVTLFTKDKKDELFNVRIEQVGVFKVDGGIAAEEMEKVLFIHGSTMLFPFASSEIASITMKSGFTPVMMELVDFSKVYEMYKNNR